MSTPYRVKVRAVACFALNHAARGRHLKRAVLLITDGQDNASHYRFAEVRRQLRESDVTVYAVQVARPTKRRGPRET